ncbi:MAG: ABC transporter permease [Lachnospiraceae bacterium]
MGFMIIMKKELYRVFKDKKMIFSLFFLPVIMIIGICVLIFVLISNMQDDIQSHVPLVYVQNAPEDFKLMLDSDSAATATFLDAEDDISEIKNEILSGKADLLIIFPKEFNEMLQSTTQENVALPQIRTFYNPSEDYSAEARDRYVSVYLEEYRIQKLEERFGNLEYTQIFTIDSDNSEGMIQDENKAAGKVLGMFVPYFITIMLFTGAMTMGIDVFTGEKERGTMANLLLTPLKRSEIVFGKIAALSLLSILSAMVYVISILIAIPVAVQSIGAEERLEGFSITFSPLQIFEMLVLVIGIVLLYVGIVGMVSIMSKTVKVAQTYVSVLYMLVIVSSMITMYSSEVKDMTSYLIPVFNTSVAFRGIFSQSLTMEGFLITIVITYLIDLLLILGIASAFKSEKVMI